MTASVSHNQAQAPTCSDFRHHCRCPCLNSCENPHPRPARRRCLRSGRTVPGVPRSAPHRRACASSADTCRVPLVTITTPGFMSVVATACEPESSGGRNSEGVRTLALEVMKTKRNSSPSCFSVAASDPAQWILTSASSDEPMVPFARKSSKRPVTRGRNSPDLLPVHARLAVARIRDLMPGRQQHRIPPLARKFLPDLLRRKAQDWRQPSHHGLGDVVHGRLRRATRHTGGRASYRADP